VGRSTMAAVLGLVVTVLAVAAAARLAHAAPAAAQERPDSAVELDPVVVRVLRTSVGTGTPYTVSVATGEELRRARGGAFLEEALRSLPGVQVQTRYNLAAAERLAIRGFGARAQFGIRGVRVLVDGIPATLPDGQTALDHLDLANLGRVELLRGPGAALYGNAAGGVLHFETLPAPARGAQVEVESSTGSHGLRTLQGAVAGALGAAGGFRASVADFRFDGFRTNPLDASGEAYGAASRTILNTTATFPVRDGALRVVFNGLEMEADNPGSLSDELLDEGDRQAYRFNVIQGTREDIRQGQLGLTWTGALGALDGEVGVWGIRRDFLGAIPPAVVGFDRNVGGVRALFQGDHPVGPGLLTLGGGVEIELQSDDRRNWENDGGVEGALTLDQDESVRSTGAFLQARLDLGPTVAILGGLRLDRFRFEAEDRFTADGADDSGERTMDAVSPSAGIVVEPLSRLELFASVATSFETPTTTELTNRPDGAGGFNPDLEPTRGLSVEGGVRGRVGAAWSFEATAYRTTLDDELVPFEVPEQEGRTFFRNAGESRHTGVEITLDGRLAPELGLRVAWTRVNGRFERYRVDGQELAGNRLPGIAPNRVDGRLSWEPTGAGFVELRGLWQDDVPVNDTNTASSPSYLLADLRGGLEGVEARGVQLAPWAAVTNLLDERYTASAFRRASPLATFGPTRSVSASLHYRW